MDKFEAKLKEVIEMSEEDRNQTIKDLKDMCICGTCSTYNECSKNALEGLYCVLGKSQECITEFKGCECPNCELAQSLDVGKIFNIYCLKGNEMEQREKLHDLDVITGGE
ncbi:DUF2769 domain-containing protein [Methanobacterium aggregans]|uniref:DUF2769 domain-containing protein n=1 Tax=Methanobacterium aggregans TaxID=1615586 RepID=UPI001AE53183|nr:DUF2769 domain-containing protein [Methanobacterium aggregans]MBP2046953.1 hypothetical protein [Methanobacterium aggregans]